MRYDAWDDDGFRAAVAEYADRHGLSIRALAKASGCSVGALCRWWRRDGFLSLLTAAVLADFCDLSLDRFVRQGVAS